MVVGVAFSDPRADGARRTLVVRRRRLALLRLTPWVVARDAADTVISAVISHSSRRSRRLHGRFVLSLVAHGG